MEHGVYTRFVKQNITTSVHLPVTNHVHRIAQPRISELPPPPRRL